MNIEIAQVFTQVISFLIVLWVLKRFAWKPFLSILDERKQKIQNEFDLIEQKKLENQKVLDLYEGQLKNASQEVKELIKQAREDSLKIAQGIEDKAKEEAEQIIVQAKEALKREVAKSRLELKEEVVKLTLLATEKIMRENLNPDKQKKLVEEFISQTGQF